MDGRRWIPETVQQRPRVLRGYSMGMCPRGRSRGTYRGGSGKKRASRAGTRSVSTLSAAQLERKRANDREAQRAIRQRTKDHIDHLERNISDLRAANDASERAAAMSHQRTRELEDENSYLRTKLGEVGYPVPDNLRSTDQTLLSAPAASPATQHGLAIPRPDSTSTPRSALSLNTSQSSSSRHGSWQQGTGQYAVTAASAAASLPAHSSVQLGPGLTGWRSHDNASSIHGPSGGLQESHQMQTQPAFQGSNTNDRSPWSTSQAYTYQEPQRTPSVQQPSPQPQQQYAQPAAQSYTSQPTGPQGSSYVSPPQHEFQGMTVQSPSGYPVPQPQSFNQTPAYQMTHMQVSPAAQTVDYATQPGHVHPPLLPPANYMTTQAEQQYPQQQMATSYSLTHYPSG